MKRIFVKGIWRRIRLQLTTMPYRLTAGYMTSYFIGGATGSLVSSWLYSHYGWPGVVTAGAVLGAITLAYGMLGASARIPEIAPSPIRA